MKFAVDPNVSMKLNFTLLTLTVLISSSCTQRQSSNVQTNFEPVYTSHNMATSDTATFGNGCFWCTEAIFQELNGVISVSSGYSGGHVENPTYEEVCDKTTGHAEVCRIVFDPAKITYDELLEVFWQTHDPTTLNRQGNDVGPQYRSVIFYHNDEQKQKAEHYKTALDKSGAFDKPIVTAVEPLKNYYAAEGYHQNYFKNNPNQPYCYFVIRPKLEKFEKAFGKKLKQ